MNEYREARESIRQTLTENIDKLEVAESGVIARMKKYKEQACELYHENKKLKADCEKYIDLFEDFKNRVERHVPEAKRALEGFSKAIESAALQCAARGCDGCFICEPEPDEEE